MIAVKAGGGGWGVGAPEVITSNCELCRFNFEIRF